MAGAGALEAPEPGALQALVERGGHCLACSLTQFLLKGIESCLRGCHRDTGARAQQLQAQMFGSLGTILLKWKMRKAGLHVLANCWSAPALF